MGKPEPILPEKERRILLELYENPGKRHDTFYLNDMLHYPDMLVPFKVPDISAVRGTPEYAAAFRETVRTIESLVEKGLIDGQQLQQENWGMYDTELKVKFKGKQAAIREKRHAEQVVKQLAELEKQMPEFVKRSSGVDEEIIKAGMKEKEK